MLQESILRDQFGISYLWPYQELTIRHVLEASENNETGRVLCCMPTGSGKSLCFMYPIALLKKRCIIIYPLLSLMNDQANRFRECNIPFVVLRGGLPPEERNELIRRIKTCEEIAVITNPEMLLSLSEKGELSYFRNRTELLVIDEVHTAITWGDSFRDSYLSLGKIIKEIQPHSVIAFTATMDKKTERSIIDRIFSGITPNIVRCSSDRDNIFYHSVPSLSKIHDIRKILSPESSRPAVIFCKSRKLSEKIALLLSPYFETTHYHAGLDRNRKIEIERMFYSSTTAVLAATTAYGLGVNKKNIRTVIHFSLPSSASDFLQESGRGGRDGKRMDSYVLYYDNEDTPLSYIFKGSKCIRTSLLKEMGEEPENEGCLSCSSCTPDSYQRAGEKEIMRYLKFHPLITEKEAINTLSSPRLFRTPLPFWEKEDISKAIEILVSEKKIKRIGKRLLRTRGQ